MRCVRHTEQHAAKDRINHDFTVAQRLTQAGFPGAKVVATDMQFPVHRECRLWQIKFQSRIGLIQIIHREVSRVIKIDCDVCIGIPGRGIGIEPGRRNGAGHLVNSAEDRRTLILVKAIRVEQLDRSIERVQVETDGVFGEVRRRRPRKQLREPFAKRPTHRQPIRSQSPQKNRDVRQVVVNAADGRRFHVSDVRNWIERRAQQAEGSG